MCLCYVCVCVCVFMRFCACGCGCGCARVTRQEVSTASELSRISNGSHHKQLITVGWGGWQNTSKKRHEREGQRQGSVR